MTPRAWWTAAALLAVLGAPRAAGAQEPGYAGSERCASCHRPDHARFSQTAKGRRMLGEPRSDLERRGCESCHGPGAAHADARGRVKPEGFVSFAANDATPIEQRNRMCLQCHEGQARMQWMGSAHDGGNVACTDCHSIMNPQSETGQLRAATALQTCGRCHSRQSRAVSASLSRMPVLEGAMACNNCHNPHGSPNERMLTQASINETCFSCHAEKRGPYLWEHAPVAENCANCHDPHGGRNEMMLNRPRPRLCQQCHLETRHPGTAMEYSTAAGVVTTSSRLVNRACNNCHTQVHGSNHPGGSRYVR